MRFKIDIINAKRIIEIVKNQIQIKIKKKKRGRPAKYEDKTILLALTLKVLFDLSFRKTQQLLKIYLQHEEIPDHTTLHYRFKKFPLEKIEELIKQTAIEIVKSMGNKEIYAAIADGTGFGYDETFYMKEKRGKEIREVKSHIKTQLLIGVVNKKKFILSAKAHNAYSDENKLLLEILKDIRVKGRYFLGDSYYGKNVKVLEKIAELGFDVIVPIKGTLRQKVRNKYRLKAKSNYENDYKKKVYKKNRYKIEQLIGNVKNWFGDRFNTKSFDIAQRLTLVSFLLYNISILVNLYFFMFIFCISLIPFIPYFVIF